jgi:hypothetical protein
MVGMYFQISKFKRKPSDAEVQFARTYGTKELYRKVQCEVSVSLGFRV